MHQLRVIEAGRTRHRAGLAIAGFRLRGLPRRPVEALQGDHGVEAARAEPFEVEGDELEAERAESAGSARRGPRG